MSLKSKWLQKIKDWINKTFGVPVATPPKTTPPTPTPAGTPTIADATTDVVPYSTLHWQGGNHAGVGRDAVLTCQLRSARVQNGVVKIDYDQKPDWPLKEHVETDPDGKIVKWHSYARLCAFSDHIDGALRGAHFDWLSVDGKGNAQKSKTLNNIYDGYLFGSQSPERGRRLWFVVVSNDGRLRTNLCEGVY